MSYIDANKVETIAAIETAVAGLSSQELQSSRHANRHQNGGFDFLQGLREKRIKFGEKADIAERISHLGGRAEEAWM